MRSRSDLLFAALIVCFCGISKLCSQETPDQSSARTIRFPGRETYGTLYTRAHNTKGDWKELGPARDYVEVPANRDLQLALSQDAIRSLGWPLIDIKPNDLQSLKVSRPLQSIDETELKAIEKLTGLEELNLAFADIGNEGLVYLKNLTSLRILNLNGNRIGAEGLGHLANLKDLEDLSLVFTQIDNAALTKLASFPNLRKLDLTSTLIDDEALRIIKEFHSLEELRVEKTAITGAGFEELASMPKLRSIGLTNLPLNGSYLRTLAKIRTLEAINLSTDMAIKSELLLPLKDLPKLRRVALSDTYIDANALSVLADFPALEELVLIGHLRQSEDLRRVAGKAPLRVLRLSTPLSEKDLKKLPELAQVKIVHPPRPDVLPSD